MYAVQFYIAQRQFWGKKPAERKKDFDCKQRKWCQMDHSIPTAVSPWRLSGLFNMVYSILCMEYKALKSFILEKKWAVGSSGNQNDQASTA